MRLLQNGYPSRDHVKYLECVFVLSKPIFQSDIKGGEEEWGLKAEPGVIECPGGDPSWPKAPSVEGPSGKPVIAGWPGKSAAFLRLIMLSAKGQSSRPSQAVTFSSPDKC